jgi:hypothetical protein
MDGVHPHQHVAGVHGVVSDVQVLPLARVREKTGRVPALAAQGSLDALLECGECGPTADS